MLCLCLDAVADVTAAGRPHHGWGESNRVLVLMEQPNPGFSIQALKQAGPGVTANVAGAGLAGVAGNIIGNMIAAKMQTAGVDAEQQKRIPALISFQKENDTLKLTADAMHASLLGESVTMVMGKPQGRRHEYVLEEILRKDDGYDQAVSLEQKLMLDDDLLSLRTAYNFVAWDLAGSDRKKLASGRVSVFFDYPPALAAAAGNPPEAAGENTAERPELNWSAAPTDLLQASMTESGRLLSTFLARQFQQPKALLSGDYVIATTATLEKVRGYRQADIGEWSVFCDEGNNCFIMKPKKVYVLKKAG